VIDFIEVLKIVIFSLDKLHKYVIIGVYDEIRNKEVQMKVCDKCGVEIYTKDGDSLCSECEDAANREKRLRGRREARRAHDEALRSLGLVKVRGALGGTYWE
jgi:hypothetical protein